MERHVEVYLRKGCYLLCPFGRAETGLWIATQPGVSVAAHAAPRILGRLVRVALAESGTSVPHPSDWRDHEFPLCAVAGVKGWRGFVGSVTGLASVEAADGSSLRVVAHQRQGSGFVPTPGPAVELPPDASDETLGKALVEVLARGRVA